MDWKGKDVINRALCVAAIVAAAVCANGEVLNVAVGPGATQDGYSSDQLAAISGGTVTEINKTGTGTIVSKGISSFTGTIRVSEGVMQVVDATGLGTSAGETIVEKGATLHFNSLSSGYTTYKSERYVVAGHGSESTTNGAIRITGATCQLSHLELSDDAAFYSGQGFHFYDDGNSTIEMGGHTLSLLSATSGNLDVEWKLDGISNPGNIEITGARYFWPYTAFPGGGEHEVRLYDRTGVIIPNANGGKTWSLVRCGTGGFYQWAYSGAWDGPFENRNTSAAIGFTVNAIRTLTFNGPLRGTGAFMKDANLGVIVLNGTNTFTSVFEAKGGTLILGCEEAAAGSVVDRFNFSNLTVMLGLAGRTSNNPAGWTAAAVKATIDACAAAKKSNVSICLYAVDGDSFTPAATFDGTTDYSKPDLGALAGGNTAWVATFENSPKFSVRTKSDLVFTAAPGSAGCGSLGNTSVCVGALRLDDAGFVDLGTSVLDLGANNGTEIAALKVCGNTVLGRAETSGGYIGLPYSMDLRGVFMEVGAGAVVTNRIQLSVGSTASAGGLYIRGGEVHTSYTGSNIGNFGGRGQAYIEVSENGSMVVDQHGHLGVFQSGIGALSLSSGKFDLLGTAMSVGVGGTGVVYQTGGVISPKAGLTIASAAYETDKTTTYAAYTVSGPSARTLVTGNVIVNARSSGTAMLNVNGGGVLSAARIVKTSAAETPAKSYLNIDGGVLVATGDASDFLGAETGTRHFPDAVTVYSGGAVIDTDGHDVVIAAPISAPSGCGIASIAINGSFSDIVAPPVITISGDGYGASAVALFDSSTRTVTGVVVTSQGCGYTAENTTITASYRGRPSTVVPCTFTLTEDRSSTPVRLTKRGAGSLTFASGTLPSGVVLSVEGGSVSGDGLAFSEYVVDAAVAAAGGAGTVQSWPSGATLNITGIESLGEDVRRFVVLGFASASAATVPPLSPGCEVPSGWRLVLHGSRLYLARKCGVLLFVR